MIEPKVKGNFFQRIHNYIKKKLGGGGLLKIGVGSEEIKMEQWYSYDAFCELLKKSEELLPDHHPSTVFRLGHYTMAEDERWQTMFKGQDPKDTFSTNKRQDALFMVGRFLVERVEDNLVQVRMTLWSNKADDNDLWAEYYWGVMQGVLDMTGTEGKITMDVEKEGEKRAWIYRALWGDSLE
jgi:hypothetical protein